MNRHNAVTASARAPKARADASAGLLLFAEAVAVVALALVGWRLQREGSAFTKLAAFEDARARADDSAVLRSVRGVGVNGRMITGAFPAGTKLVVAFFARSGTAAADIGFWRSVERDLPRGAGIRIAGYCAGAACAVARTLLRSRPSFPVVAFAEPESGQAVLNADSLGRCLLLSPGGFSRSGPVWRLAGVTPLFAARRLAGGVR